MQGACQSGRYAISFDYVPLREGVARSDGADRTCGNARRRAIPAACGCSPSARRFRADAIRAVYGLGQRAFGENYVQEGTAKIDALADLDRHRVASDRAVARQQGSARRRPLRLGADRRPDEDRRAPCRRARPAGAPPLDVCVQVNVSGEASKSGVAPAEARARSRRAVAAMPRAAAARDHGHSRADRRRGAAAARSSAACASASTPVARRGSRSTRCRWGCRRISRMRSPKARRWCAWGRAIFGARDSRRSAGA